MGGACPAMAARCAAMAGAAVAACSAAVAGSAAGVAARCAAVAGPPVAGAAVAAPLSHPGPLLRPRLHSRFGLCPLPSRTLRSHPPARCFQVSAAKKAKEGGDKTNQALSAEQQERIRKNKEAARQLLAERNVPPGFGDSWRRQLAGEFSKPYFVEVSGIPRCPRSAPSGR